jgi:hypothetical protein
VIALEQDGAGLIDIVIQLTARALGAIDVVMDLHAVEDDGDFLADDLDLGLLPLTGLAGSEQGRSLHVVDGTVAAEFGLAELGVVKDLDFMTAAEVEAAIGPGRHLVFITDDEVAELGIGQDVSAVFVLAEHIDQHAVLDTPGTFALVAAVLPAVHGLAIKQELEALLGLGGGQLVGGVGGGAVALFETERWPREV